MELTHLEKELINRGYDENLVKELTSFDISYAYKVRDIVLEDITKGCTIKPDPKAIYIGGQPGSGKTTLLRTIKNNWKKNDVIPIIGLDNYRIYHPNYNKIEKAINEYWKDKEETKDSSRSNDIADFTSNFAGTVSDLIIENITDKKYNIAIEWGMRKPEVPLATMEELKNKGYYNIVEFIVVDKYTSKEACKIRDDILNKHDLILRRIPEYFHDDAISSLPSSAEQIFIEGYLNKKTIDEFKLIDRDGNILWNNNSEEKLIDTYRYYLDKKQDNLKNNPEYGELSYLEETKK